MNKMGVIKDKENLRDDIQNKMPYNIILENYFAIKEKGYSLKLNLGKNPENEKNSKFKYLSLKDKLNENFDVSCKFKNKEWMKNIGYLLRLEFHYVLCLI